MVDLRQKLKAYVDNCGSLASAAKRIGYSTATISTYLNDTYKGNVTKLEARLNEIFANLEAEKAIAKIAGEYVPTSISQGVYDTIRLCHLKGGIAIECGDAGIGKTVACRQYARDYPSTSVYMTVNPCTATVTAFLKYLCMILGLPNGRKDDMWFRITQRLNGERKVLIIDEAQHLPIKTIETIRSFFDAYPSIGVCLVGNEDTYNNLHHGKAAFAQIINRTKISETRHTEQITEHDIELLFPPLQGKRKEIKLMLRVARSEQGIRGAKNLFSNATDNQDISYAGLIAVAHMMKIDLKTI